MTATDFLETTDLHHKDGEPVRPRVRNNRPHVGSVNGGSNVADVRFQIETKRGVSFWESVQITLNGAPRTSRIVGRRRGNASPYRHTNGLALPPDVVLRSVYSRSRTAMLDVLDVVGVDAASFTHTPEWNRVSYGITEFTHVPCERVVLVDAFVATPSGKQMVQSALLLAAKAGDNGVTQEQLVLTTGSNPLTVLAIMDGLEFQNVVRPESSSDSLTPATPVAYWANAKLETAIPLTPFACARGWELDADESERLGTNILSAQDGRRTKEMALSIDELSLPTAV